MNVHALPVRLRTAIGGATSTRPSRHVSKAAAHDPRWPRIEAALVARSALAGSTFAEDIERQPSGASGDWHWRIHLQPQQIPLREEDGRPAPGAPLRAAMATVEVTRGKDGPTVMTWTTWKPYRAVQ